MLVFIGGGGSGLSALVNIFWEIGLKEIIVLDKSKSQITDYLESKGINVIIGDGIYKFKPDDIIFYSDAVIHSKDFKNAENNRKFSYFDFIGEISKWFKTIAVAGTHGKTSTTSMLINCIKTNDTFALGIVGGLVPDLGNKNFFINKNLFSDIKLIFKAILSLKGKKPVHLFKKYYFVIEADEFNRHFLLLDPYISLITKVDYDHKDVYSTYEDYIKAFKIFIQKTRNFVLTADAEFSQKTGVSLINFDNINLKYVFGEHMQKNACLVKAFFEKYNSLKFNLKCLENFRGIWRRQEYLGKFGNLDVYTDYAHHPVEILATYKSFYEKFSNKEIFVVFQPHQLFRFFSYKNEFENVLKNIKNLIIYNIYSVRETDLLKNLWERQGNKYNDDVSNKQILNLVGEEIAKSVGGVYINNMQDLLSFIKNKKGVLLLMTAGDLDYKFRQII